MKPLDIVYSDNHLLVVIKPAGVLSQGDATGDLSLLDWAKDWIKQTYDKPGNVYLGLVHRLDRPVGGVMVFARTSKSAARLSAQFRERTVRKQYTAMVNGVVQKSQDTLQGTYQSKTETLTYKCLKSGHQRTLIEVHPKTGRKHQIRRQLSDIGHPIVGDLRYGDTQPLPGRQIALFAHALTLEHPTKKNTVTFEAPLPPWWPELI